MLFESLRRNLGLKITSLILAVFLWSYVKYTSTPYASMTSEANIDVPLSVEGKSDNLIALDVPEKITLYVKGSPERLAKVKPENFKATLNLTGRKAGFFSVPVSVVAPPDVKVVRVSPDKTAVRLDPLEKRLIPVKIETSGTLSGGFILGKMQAKPESVMISGAQSVVSRVKEARVICDIDGADADQIQRTAVEAVDENGRLVEEVKSEPGLVRATVNIEHEVKNGVVPVSPSITGNPASGYQVERITVTPPTAVIQYPYSLQPAPSVVVTQDISVDGASSSIARDVPVVSPRDASLLEPKSVKVHIMISPVSDSRHKKTGP